MRATISLDNKSFAQAEKYARESLKNCDDILNSHLALTDVLQTKGDYAALIEALKTIDAKFEIEWNDFEDDEDFRSSPHFQEWQEYLNSK